MITYKVKKIACSFLYVKRECLAPNGVYTRTLDKVLEPAPVNYICIVKHCPILGIDDVRPFSFTYDIPLLSLAGIVHCQTIRQAYVYMKALACNCLLYTSPSPRDGLLSRMPSSA